MENDSVNAVETLSSSALTPELIGQIERDALSETALLTPRCRKILRMLREGAALEKIQPQLWRIQRALSAPGGLAAAAAGEHPASLTPSERSLALDTLVSELRAGAAAARIAVLRRKLFFTIREAANLFTRNSGFYDLLIIADLDGRIVAANTVDAAGRSLNTSSLIGSSVKGEEWFEQCARGGIRAGDHEGANADAQRPGDDHGRVPDLAQGQRRD